MCFLLLLIHYIKVLTKHNCYISPQRKITYLFVKVQVKVQWLQVNLVGGGCGGAQGQPFVRAGARPLSVLGSRFLPLNAPHYLRLLTLNSPLQQLQVKLLLPLPLKTHTDKKMDGEICFTRCFQPSNYEGKFENQIISLDTSFHEASCVQWLSLVCEWF